MDYRCRVGAWALVASSLLVTAASAEDAAELSSAAVGAYQRGEFAAAGRLFDRAVAAGDPDVATYVNAACVYARAGEQETAFARLQTALERGFTGCDMLSRDADLVSLRSDARWKEIAQACESSRAQRERFWNGPTWTAGYRENLSSEEKIAGLSRLWAEAKFGFVNFSLVPELDWDAELVRFIPRVVATRSTREYYAVLDEFVALLHDGHSSVVAPPELRDAVWSEPGLTTRLVEGRVLIHHVFDPELASQGVVPGLEIVSIGGEPVRRFAEREVMPRVASSTPQDRESRTFERQLLLGPTGTSLDLGLADAAGKTRVVTARRIAPAEWMKLYPSRPPVSLAMVAPGVAYVEIRTFNGDEVVGKFEALLPALHEARAVVLDLRDNGGGNSGNADRILASFTNGEFRAQTWWARDYRAVQRAWGSPEGRFESTSTIVGKAPERWRPAVVLLVGPRTFSAAEDFTVAFVNGRRGKVVGEPTGGSTGQPLSFALPGGGRGLVCTKRNTLANGKEFIGVGIVPEVVVHPSVAATRAGRDEALETALRVIGEP